MKTLVVNLYGAPCSGKSVKMLQLGVVGKLRGAFCEICAEVAKEYVVQGIPITGEVQRALTREQTRRMLCFVGNVEVVVTDAPPLIGAFYAGYHCMEGAAEMVELFEGYRQKIAARADRVANVYMWRDHPYEPRGRIESEGEDAEIARQMWAFVRERYAEEALFEARSTDSPEALWERVAG
jgi:hypothetical protein